LRFPDLLCPELSRLLLEEDVVARERLLPAPEVLVPEVLDCVLGGEAFEDDPLYRLPELCTGADRLFPEGFAEIATVLGAVATTGALLCEPTGVVRERPCLEPERYRISPLPFLERYAFVGSVTRVFVRLPGSETGLIGDDAT